MGNDVASIEPKPETFALAFAAVKPFVPTMVNFKLETIQRGVVPADPVVRIMLMKLLTQLQLLLADGQVPIESTPLSDSRDRSAKTIRSGLAFDDPRARRDLPQ